MNYTSYFVGDDLPDVPLIWTLFRVAEDVDPYDEKGIRKAKSSAEAELLYTRNNNLSLVVLAIPFDTVSIVAITYLKFKLFLA